MPRLGVGMPIIAGVSQEAVTAIDDFFFESHTSGEVTPINTATRSNLFTYSHDFSQSSWTKADSAVSTSAVKNPFGETATAANGPYKLVTSSASNQVYIRETLTTVVGKYYTFSVFAQKAEYDYIALVGLNPTTIHYFNLANGTTASAHSIQPVIEDAGNGWYRCSVTLVADTTSKFFGIYLAGDSGNISLGSVADDNGIYIYGAQVEQNSPVSALITSSGEAGTATTALSDTSEVWDFDSTDIMLEADPEDEGFWEEGSNIVTNGDFATDSDWSKGTGWTISDGKAHADVSSTAALSQTLSTGAGNTYDVTLTISNLTAGSIQPQFGGTLATPTSANSNGTHNFKITATGSSSGLLLYALNTSAFSIDNITVKEYAITPLDV